MSRFDPYAPLARATRAVPYDFVLEQLATLAPTTRAMFGATAVYLDERIVFLLRKKGDSDDGVWLCFEPAAEAEVTRLLPRLRAIDVLGNVRSWRKLAASSEQFEDDVLLACKLLREGDSSIGKIPDRLKKKQNEKTKKAGAPAPKSQGKKPTKRA